MLKRISFAIISFIIFAACAWAQEAATPVRWRSFIKTAPDGTGTVTFRALVTPGWHLYGLSIPEGGPKATTFDLSGSTGVKFVSAVTPKRKPIEVEDKLFDMTLTWWDSNVEFTVPFKVTDKDSARINCKISYMACDGTSCRPPKTENISIPVKPAK